MPIFLYEGRTKLEHFSAEFYPVFMAHGPKHVGQGGGAAVEHAHLAPAGVLLAAD